MKNIFINITIMLILSGCSAAFVGHSGDLSKYEENYNAKICDNELISSKLNSSSDLILWYELAGSLKRNCADYNASNYYFDAAEELYKSDVDLQNIASKSLQTFADTLLNDNVTDYKGNTYEAIMINTYKGLNFMSLGDFKNARIEFNRALDRQRRAKDEFEKEIKSQIKQISKEQNDIISNKITLQTINQAYEDTGIFADFKVYTNFVNPFTTYMAGLFFIADKDYKKARDMLKESVAMQPNNTFLKQELKLVEKLLSSKKHKQTYIWLIYENGKSMQKDEFALNVPLFLVSSKALYAGIAFPILKERTYSYEFLQINSTKSTQIASMDSVIKTEFQTKLPFVITKALLRTTLKTLAQTQASKENPYAGLALSIFNVATNRADSRSWVSLPKSFHALRIENKTGNFDIQTPNGVVVKTYEIPANKNAIIYINSPVQGVDSMHKIIF